MSVPPNAARLTSHLGPRTLALAYLAACLLAVGMLGRFSDAGFSASTAAAGSLEAGDWYRYTSVAAGQRFACASNINDVLTCWGANNAGQLGNGALVDSSTPVRVLGPGGSGHLLGVRQVTAGLAFACGAKADGTVWCWGANAKGQLGNGAFVDSSTPVQVRGVGGSGFLTSVVDIAAGQEHVCAVTSSGSVHCWGKGSVGELAQVAMANSATPVQAVGVGGAGTLSGITAVGSGSDHTCAVGAAGAVFCWGQGTSGQLGNGASVTSATPVQVTGVGGSGTLTGAIDVDGGDFHTCARTSGALYCWGSNQSGQLGPGADGTVMWKNSGDTSPDQSLYASGSLATSSSTQAVGDWRIVQGASSAKRQEAIAVGVTTGAVVSGQMLAGAGWQPLPFNNMATLTQSTWWSAAVAYESASGDAVLVWSNGTTGSTGLTYRVWNGSTWSNAATIATPLAGQAQQLRLAASPSSDRMVLVVSNAAGQDYALFWNGSAWASSATLTTTNDTRTEVNVAFEQQSGHAMVVYAKGSADMYYRMWDGTTLGAEAQVGLPAGTSGTSTSRWSSIAADPGSDRIVLGVQNQVPDGWVAVWNGSAWTDKLTVTNAGNGTGSPWLAVSFERTSGDALVVYGEPNRLMRYRTWSSGAAWSAELDGPDMGSGQYPNSVTLHPRSSSDEVMMVAQDGSSNLEMSAWSGTAWGGAVQAASNTGELANQPFIYFWDLVDPPSGSATPLQVAGQDGAGFLSGVAQHTTGTTATCASLSSGAAYCWGKNNAGQLGDGTVLTRNYPSRVVGAGGAGTFGTAGVLTQAKNSGTSGCSVRTDPALWANEARRDEEVWCWGSNTRGQLGDGTLVSRSYPAAISGS